MAEDLLPGPTAASCCPNVQLSRSYALSSRRLLSLDEGARYYPPLFRLWDIKFSQLGRRGRQGNSWYLRYGEVLRQSRMGTRVEHASAKGYSHHIANTLNRELCTRQRRK
ncbi:hypothetical protein HETIRDRAFT_321552 [Heterobasidion irregulare TC 32-1]|uniref:Uncharacterized protein n=1 Tax=Heterobasidion irregulare (strain TC 32-1) TaxID=747525 RepID=W4K3I9_HETIT|nr:uncharacterized protein HETIRDRAFT_321552 [Heterobasidion irregulare TC 32-1]ETW79641.1 hypothetical protein HETIRDRAFT_321552 [Heterobasidion irregulare TC 32-1]